MKCFSYLRLKRKSREILYFHNKKKHVLSYFTIELYIELADLNMPGLTKSEIIYMTLI